MVGRRPTPYIPEEHDGSALLGLVGLVRLVGLVGIVGLLGLLRLLGLSGALLATNRLPT